MCCIIHYIADPTAVYWGMPEIKIKMDMYLILPVKLCPCIVYDVYHVIIRKTIWDGDRFRFNYLFSFNIIYSCISLKYNLINRNLSYLHIFIVIGTNIIV